MTSGHNAAGGEGREQLQAKYNARKIKQSKVNGTGSGLELDKE